MPGKKAWKNSCGLPSGPSATEACPGAHQSRLDLSNVNAGIYDDVTAGLNWYWSDRVRVMFDWIHPLPNAQTVFGAAQADILAMRFDWNW